jgi:hypothetical protein
MPRSEAQLHSASAGAAMIFSRPASHFGRSGRQGVDGSLTGFSLFSLTHLAGPDVRGRRDVLVGKSSHPTCLVCVCVCVDVSGWRKGYLWESLTAMRVLYHVVSRALAGQCAWASERGMDC